MAYLSNITDKTIWLVGASSGIGRCLATQLAKAGNTVIVSARSEDKLQALACLLYTSPSPRDRTRSRMPSSA